MKNTKPLYLLILGAILIASTHMRFGFGFLIFIEAIPFLIYLERSQTLRSQILLFAFLFLGWSLAIAKIVTDPLPWFITFGFSLPISFFKYLPFLGYLLFKDSKYSEWLFPAMLVIGEWLQASFSPFASWGSVAYTQINNPIWLQIVSVGGIWMLSYSIYFIVYQIYLLIGQGYTHKIGVRLITPVLILSLFGTVRLTLAENKSVESIIVAAVGTNSIIGGPDMPSADARSRNRSDIYDRMRIAGQAGAKLIVWTEAAAGLLPNEEQSFQTEVSQLSDSLKVTSVISYVVLQSTDPFLYENKYILVDSTGEITSTYHKHEPVPGEPCIPGVESHEVYNLDGVIRQYLPDTFHYI